MNEIEKINTIAILIDIIDGMLNELQPEYRHGMKRLCKNALKHTKHFVKECDKIHSSKNQIYFGVNSDALRSHLEPIVKTEIENWIKD